MIESKVPSLRVRSLKEGPIRKDGDWILYWMTAYRRPKSNFSLDRALDWARALRRPLLILEALRVRYPWSSLRFHRFIIEGMRDNQKAFLNSPIHYFPYVEPEPGRASGLLASLAARACVVVSDDFPCFFHPYLYSRIASKLDLRLELVDSNGIMPLRAADRTFTVAHSYRRFMQKTIPSHFEDFPRDHRLAQLKLPPLKSLPREIHQRWKATDLDRLLSDQGDLKQFPIDHSVAETPMIGGHREAERRLEAFVSRKLLGYEMNRNEPDEEGSSGLSPYLHFGHLSAHQAFQAILHQSGWSPEKLLKPNGKVNGFWNVDADSEAFLDQLLTWREIGFNMCSREPNYDRFESLPTWAKQTLHEHARDRRPWIYSRDLFEQAGTHDPLWNAAQLQLIREGRIHNYLRMLWGKKILHWSASPEEALDTMIHLNNKYALDGRDPNSYSGIFWVLGRYDRAWGPEREVLGKIRYMTSESTANKWHVKKYLARYSSDTRFER